MPILQDLYETAWGWDDLKKQKELTSAHARYIVAFSRSSAEHQPVAFTHFRFEAEGNMPVLYVYEIQVEAHAQRKGLGRYEILDSIHAVCRLIAVKKGEALVAVKDTALPSLICSMIDASICRFMMQLLELIAWRRGMHACMLTVLDVNIAAKCAYAKLGYTIDPSSPNEEDGLPGYSILSKVLAKKHG